MQTNGLFLAPVDPSAVTSINLASHHCDAATLFMPTTVLFLEHEYERRLPTPNINYLAIHLWHQIVTDAFQAHSPPPPMSTHQPWGLPGGARLSSWRSCWTAVAWSTWLPGAAAMTCALLSAARVTLVRVIYIYSNEMKTSFASCTMLHLISKLNPNKSFTLNQ